MENLPAKDTQAVLEEAMKNELQDRAIRESCHEDDWYLGYRSACMDFKEMLIDFMVQSNDSATQRFLNQTLEKVRNRERALRDLDL